MGVQLHLPKAMQRLRMWSLSGDPGMGLPLLCVIMSERYMDAMPVMSPVHGMLTVNAAKENDVTSCMSRVACACV